MARLSNQISIMAALVLSSCSSAAPNKSESPDEVNSAQAKIATAPASVEAEPQLGRCFDGVCSWSKETKRDTVKTSMAGRLIVLSVLGGSSSHSNVKNYPSKFEVGEQIVWNDKAHELYVFCSKKLPAVMMKVDGKWQADVLDFVEGPPGILESTANIYTSVCHGPKVHWWDKNFSKKFGYVSFGGETPDVTVSRPEDIFARAAALPDNSGEIPQAFLGDWEREIAFCKHDGEADENETIHISRGKITWIEGGMTVRTVRILSPNHISVNGLEFGDGDPDPNGRTMELTLTSSGKLNGFGEAVVKCPA